MEKKKIKVLCITRKYPPSVGGMENLCYWVFNGLKDDEIDVKIVSMGKSQINLIWFFPFTIFYVLFCARKYDALLLGDSLMCFLGNVCHLVSRKTKRFVIVHGLDFTFRNKLYQLYLRMFYKKSADEYICNSHETQRQLADWGISYSKVITPGIDTAKFNGVTVDKKAFKEKYNIPAENLVLITVGRIVKRKGVAWFAENVMTKLRDKSVTYLVIGDGPNKEAVQEVIRKEHLESQVLLLGRISDEDMLQCYCNADVFVMSNISVENDIEGFGIVALEASLAGLVVVASRIDGIVDAIIDKKNGYMMESRNEEQYFEIISKIMQDREAFENDRKAFPVYTSEHYSWESICNQYKQLIAEVCRK